MQKVWVYELYNKNDASNNLKILINIFCYCKFAIRIMRQNHHLLLLRIGGAICQKQLVDYYYFYGRRGILILSFLYLK